MSDATTQQVDAQLTWPDLDADYYLMGDEECGVGVQCKVCDRGGAPVAYLTTRGDKAYAGTDVHVVYTIGEMLAAALSHRHSV